MISPVNNIPEACESFTNQMGVSSGKNEYTYITKTVNPIESVDCDNFRNTERGMKGRKL
ncbi:MAG TPA: hypothetical protein PKY26_08365 [Acetivibrio clariflavus]|nr:hypothetical protein [Acetivibrio clariflavus]